MQDAVGGLTGDADTQARGKFNQSAGAVQDTVGEVWERASNLYDEAESYAKQQPLVALAVTLGLGVVTGLVLNGGRKVVNQDGRRPCVGLAKLLQKTPSSIAERTPETAAAVREIVGCPIAVRA